MYGQKPPTRLPYIPHEAMVEEADRSLQARENTIRFLKHHLYLAQQHMKNQADKHMSFREFQLGDMVYVKFQSYRQLSLKFILHSMSRSQRSIKELLQWHLPFLCLYLIMVM